jgi:hypothetical protein
MDTKSKMMARAQKSNSLAEVINGLMDPTASIALLVLLEISGLVLVLLFRIPFVPRATRAVQEILCLVFVMEF